MEYLTCGSKIGVTCQRTYVAEDQGNKKTKLQSIFENKQAY